MKYEALNPEDNRTILKSIVKSNNHSVIVTLINGDILFGDLHLDMQFFETPPEGEEWFVAKKMTGEFLAVKLEPEKLFFNTIDGHEAGDCLFITLNKDIIVDIQHLNWIGLEPVKDMPNPYATMTCEHNIEVAKKFDLTIEEYCEFSLSEENLPPNGIELKGEQLLYVDWDFMSKLLGGGTPSVGAYGAGLKLGRNEFNFALDKIKNGKIEKILKFLPGSFPFEEGRISGYLVFPTEQITTKIENEDCIIALCCKTKSFDPEEPYVPLILKNKGFRYPLEYLPYLISEIVFYGEILDIPVYEQGIVSNACLMVRGVANLKIK